MAENPMKPPLLLTRPLQQSQRFSGAFRARFGANWPVHIAPLSQTVFLDAGLDIADVDALIFTSETGVAGFARLSQRRDLPAWCVGQHTAAAERAAGFAAIAGPGDARALAGRIRAEAATGRFLHVRGRVVAVDLEKMLNTAGTVTKSVICYDQIACPLNDAARALLGDDMPVLVPLFSPGSAKLFVAAGAGARAPLLVAMMSGAVAQAAGSLHAAQRMVSPAPDAQGMLDTLGRLIAAARDRA